MATLQTMTLTANQGETVLSDWINISAANRLILQVEAKQGGEYTVSIAQSTFDPTQNTPIVLYTEPDYTCGQLDNTGYVAQTSIFDRTEHFEANHIQIAFTNISTETTVKCFLILD